MIKKKRNLFIKLGLCVSAFVSLVCALTIPSKAYTINNDGNLVSDNLADITLGYVLNPNDGSVVENPSGLISNYIVYSDDFVISNLVWNSAYTFVCWYDSDYNFISRTGADVISIFYSTDETIPSNTSYFRFTNYYYNSNIMSNINIMCNYGSTALPYEYYGTWYSQYNYEHYGDVRYVEGMNVAYDSVVNIPITTLYSSLSAEYYNPSTEEFTRVTHFSLDDLSTPGYLDINVDSSGGNWIYFTFNFSDDYYINNVVIKNAYPPYYTAKVLNQGYTFNSDNNSDDSIWFVNDMLASYNGTTRKLQVALFSASTRNSTFSIRINAFVGGVLDTQGAFNNGYNIGYDTAEREYINQVTQLEEANAVLQHQISLGTTNANALFWTIASTPFESFKTIWNVDVLGLNISGFVLGVLMALIILYIIKKVW